MKIEHNVLTDEIIEKDFTAAELKQIEKDRADYLAAQSEKENKIAARQAVLTKLGLTAEEVATLLA